MSTPVGIVASQGKLYFMTSASTWKVKRLTSNPRVTVALGTYSRKVLGLAIEGTVHRLSGEELKRARALLRTGVLGRFWGLVFDIRNPDDKTAVYEISLAAENVNQETLASSHS